MVAEQDSVGAGRHGPRRAWLAVTVLAVVSMLNFIDRFLPAVLAEPIKKELGLSDTAIGVINGFGFLIVYAVMVVFIARIADRGMFGLVIGGCLTMWGAMTVAGGMVTSGLQLALSRVGVAVGEAGSTPAAHAYVAHNFEPERRAAPLAVITLSYPLASTAGILGGGLLAEQFGWRTAFFAMGAASVLLAPVVLLALGPRQEIPVADSSNPRQESVKWWELLRKRSYLTIVLAAACLSVAAYSLNTFAPAFLMRAHQMSLGEVGIQFGLASGLVGVVGLLIVGWLADRLVVRDPRWPLWIVTALTSVAIPFSALALVVDSRALCVWFVSISFLVGNAYLAPTIAAMQRLVQPQQRATASAIFLFFGATIGSAGPFVTGLISDALRTDLGNASLGRALILVPVVQAVGVILFLLACRWYRREIVEQPGQRATATPV